MGSPIQSKSPPLPDLDKTDLWAVLSKVDAPRQTTKLVQMSSPDKTTRWAFTAYMDEWEMIHAAVDSVKQSNDSAFRMIKYQQEECPTTKKQHYQGAIQTHKQMRFSGIRKLLPGVHLEPAKNWVALLSYCEKSDTKVAGGSSANVESSYKPMKIHDLLTEFARIYLSILECPFCNELPEECSCNKEETDRQTDKDIEYWYLASIYLRQHPEMAGLIGQPMPQNLWKNTKQVWISRAKAN